MFYFRDYPPPMEESTRQSFFWISNHKDLDLELEKKKKKKKVQYSYHFIYIVAIFHTIYLIWSVLATYPELLLSALQWFTVLVFVCWKLELPQTSLLLIFHFLVLFPSLYRPSAIPPSISVTICDRLGWLTDLLSLITLPSLPPARCEHFSLCMCAERLLSVTS